MIPFKTFKKQVQVVLACFILHNFIKRHSQNNEPEWESEGEDENEVVPDRDGPQEVNSDDEEDDAFLRNRDVIALNLWMRYTPPV